MCGQIPNSRLLPKTANNLDVMTFDAASKRWVAMPGGGAGFDPTANQSISGNYSFSKPIQLAQFAGVPDAPAFGHSIYTATSKVESRFFKESGFKHHFNFSNLTADQTIFIPDAGGTMVTTAALGGYLKLGAALDGTLRGVTDFAGTVSPLQLSNSQIGMNFSGVAQPIVWRANATLTDYSGWHDGNGTYRFLTKQNAQMFFNIAYNLTFADGFSAKSYMTSTGSLGLGISSGISSRLQVRSDGTNPTAKFENSTGTAATHTFRDTTALEFGTQTVYISATANGTSTSTSGRGLLFQGASGQGIHQFNFVSNNAETSGTIGGMNISAAYGAASGTALFQPQRITYTINNTGAVTGTATGFFMNATETALNGMLHNVMTLQVGGTTRFNITNAGWLYTGNNIELAGSQIIMASSNRLVSNSSGVLMLIDNAFSSFNKLQFGGSNHLTGAIKKSGTELRFQLADGSDNSPVGASMFKGYSDTSNKLGLVIDTNRVYGNGIYLGSNYSLKWSSVSDDMTATLDVGLSRFGAGILQVTDGAGGCGGFKACHFQSSDLAAGGLNVSRPIKFGGMGDITVTELNDLGLDKQIAMQHDGTVVYVPASTLQFT